MKLENCDVNKLQTALNQIKKINYKSLESLSNDVLCEQWQSHSNKKISKAIKELVSEYKEILDSVTRYQQIIPKLNQYRELSNEMSTINYYIQEYSNRINWCDSKDTVNLQRYNNNLNYYKNKLYNNTSSMKSLSDSIEQILK